jgi:hypothetical protein
MDASLFCKDAEVDGRKTYAVLAFFGDKKIVEGL